MGKITEIKVNPGGQVRGIRLSNNERPSHILVNFTKKNIEAIFDDPDGTGNFFRWLIQEVIPSLTSQESGSNDIPSASNIMKNILNGEEVIVYSPLEPIEEGLLSTGQRPDFILVKFTKKDIKEAVSDGGYRLFSWLVRRVSMTLPSESKPRVLLEKPPLGIIPKELWYAQRLNNLKEAIQRRQERKEGVSCAAEYLVYLLADTELLKLVKEYQEMLKRIEE